MALPPLEPGDLIGDRYRLEELIGTGGMGAVWRAFHTRLEVHVAVKFMASVHDGSTLSEQRFRREAHAAARLRSPNVVVIHDYGMHEARPYIVMELLEGEDLERRLRRSRRMDPEEVAQIVTQIAAALDVAHEARIVHRDLKPANVFITEASGRKLVKVLDFGIAKQTGAELAAAETSSSVLLGSPFYMSPEQVRGMRIGIESDFWALGVVAYELLTGERPFARASLGDLVLAICSEDPTPPSQLVAGLDPAFDAFFARALSRSPSERFGSALSLAREFERLASRARTSSAPLAADPRPVLGRLDETLSETNVGMTATRPLPKTGRRPRRAITIAVVALGSAGALAILLFVRNERAEVPEISAASSEKRAQSSSEGAIAAPSVAASSADVARETAATPSTRPSERRAPVRGQRPKALEQPPSAARSANPTAVDPLFGVPVSEGRKAP